MKLIDWRMMFCCSMLFLLSDFLVPDSADISEDGSTATWQSKTYRQLPSEGLSSITTKATWWEWLIGELGAWKLDDGHVYPKEMQTKLAYDPTFSRRMVFFMRLWPLKENNQNLYLKRQSLIVFVLNYGKCSCVFQWNQRFPVVSFIKAYFYYLLYYFDHFWYWKQQSFSISCI